MSRRLGWAAALIAVLVGCKGESPQGQLVTTTTLPAAATTTTARSDDDDHRGAPLGQSPR